MPNTYFSPEKDKMLLDKGIDPAMVYEQLQEIQTYKSANKSADPLVSDSYTLGGKYQYETNPVTPFEEFINSYTNMVYNTTPKGITNLVPTIGLAVSKKDGKTAEFFDKWIEGSDKFFNSYKLRSGATGNFIDDPSMVNFASGIGQGLGFIASMYALSGLAGADKYGKLARYAVGTAVGSPTLQTMYYDEAMDKGLDKKSAAIFSSILAPVSALSEYVGLEGLGNAMTKPLLKEVRKKALTAGIKEFVEKGADDAAMYEAASLSSKIYAQGFKEALGNVAYRGTRAAFAEGGQEFAQSYLEEGAKQLYDTYFAKEADAKFGADVRGNFRSAVNDAIFGGILGFALGGSGSVYNPVFEESLFNVVDKASDKKVIATKLKKVVGKSLESGKLDEQEAQYGNALIDKVVDFTSQQIPSTINNPIARFQAFRLTSLASDLQSQLSGNPLLQPDYVAEQVDLVNAALKSIANSDKPIADFNGLLREVNGIEKRYKNPTTETAEEGVGEAVEAGDYGVEAVGADELNQGSQVETDVADTEDKQMVIKNNFGEIKSNDIQLANIEKENIDKQIATDENGNPIKIKINYDKLKNVLLNRGGKVLFRAMQGRFFTIAKVGNFYVPFYISSAGTSGKNEGEWYPFFGYNNWLVKGSVKNGKMAYSEKIDEVTKLLNENLQIPAKYFTQFGQIITGGTPVNPVKILYDINEDMPYESWFVDFDRKAGNTYTEEQFVADRTGLNPKMVVNNGGGSADSWINDIIALTEDSEIASKGVIKNQSEANKSKNEGVGEGVITPVQEIEVTVTPEVQLSEYEAIYERNQEKLNKLRKGKLKKGETRESRDMAIANLEQQEFMVKEKIDALRSQIASSVNVEPDNIAEEVRVKLDEELSNPQDGSVGVGGGVELPNYGKTVDTKMGKVDLVIEPNIQSENKNSIKVSAYDSYGNTLGFSSAVIDAKNKTLTVKVSQIKDKYQRNGIYSKIIDEYETIAKDKGLKLEREVEGETKASKDFWNNREKKGVAPDEEVSSPLKDVESTAKALEGKDFDELSKNISIEPAKEISKSEDFETATKAILTAPNKGIASLMLGEETQVSKKQNVHTHTYPKTGKTLNWDLSVYENGRGQKRYVLYDRKYPEQIDAAALVDKNGVILQITTDKDFRKIGLAQTLLSEVKSDFGKIVASEPVSKAGKKALDNFTKQQIAEAYHKAKQDGSNPELVKAVEELITNENIQDATKITGAESVDVGEPSRNGEAVGEGNAQKEEVAEKEEEKEVVSPTEQVEQPAEFEEVKQAKEKFYKHTEDKGYVEVKRAKPVYIFGTEKAFYVKEGKEFVVSDAITGAEIGRGSTLNNAVASAEENAGSVQNLESARERFTDAYGKSPYAKLQEEFSFTQSIINNAMDAAEDGIQDMTLDDMEDKGIIKRDCE